MRRKDWSIPAMVFEVVDIMIGFGYIGLQIYYGFLYHIVFYKILMNLIVAVLVYTGLTLLAIYPERMNSLPPEQCVGKVRVYSIRMVRIEKFLFLISLLVPCICDVIKVKVPSLYNVGVILAMVAMAIFYETRIILEFRKANR